MHLTREEEAVLDGESGPTLQKAMEIITALGDIFKADSLVPIKSAQIAGVSYKTIGDAGLEWISDLEGKVVVPSILNPAGMDLERWREMGIDEEFAARQTRIIEAYRRLGVRCECTCTPYHIDPTLACFGDHLAWSESSAVSYANSVIGARTNREGGPSALAAALIGKTANYGYHLDEKRVPVITVQVDCPLSGADYGALGYLIGAQVGADVPMFRLRSRPTELELKALGAAMAASGAVALYHVEGVTPESDSYQAPAETITIERIQIDEVFEKNCPEEVDLIALGCPHYSAEELEAAANLLEGVTMNKEVWICTSRQVRDKNPDAVHRIEASGARVFVDTCMVVSPATDRFGCVLTDSGKAFKYIPGMCGVGSGLASTLDCLKGRDID
ncbi:MAG: aconitase X catalytic domain-containing protein [ANME-2 cluster archaeon]|nr:aconitase X catalytic domain-containing protein [ANME-2 cluster archaeon]